MLTRGEASSKSQTSLHQPCGEEYRHLDKPDEAEELAQSQFLEETAQNMQDVTLQISISAEDYERASDAAMELNQTVPEWIQDMINMSLKP